MHPDLKFCFRSLSRFIYYVTDEEDRFIREIREMLKDYAPRTHVYNAAFGLMSIDALMEDWRSRVHKESPSPGIHDALINIYKEDPRREQNFYIITDPEQWLTDAHVVRRILNIVHQQQANTTTVKFLVFVGPRLVLPRALQPYLEVIHDQGLSEDDIREIVEPTCNRVNVSMSANLVNSMKGLTSYGVGTALNQSLILSKREHGVHRVDPRHFMDYKRRQLRKTDLLSYVDVSDYTFEQVGGLHRFKAWIQKHKAAWTEEGQKFGLIPPKGVLLVGVWGCGKSLSVKALGNAWRLPVIQMDMGRLRTSLVGESEANVLRATSIIESVAPCILWLDEAEKGLSGGKSSNMSDSGTTARMIGHLSTWLQETKAPICLAMTANSLHDLPVEFIRRVNERFFFDMPTEDERVDILKIHLRKQRQDTDSLNLAELAADAKQMVGSEIEQAIQAALVESFDAGCESLSPEILSNELRKKPRIFKTLSEELKEILNWVGWDPECQDGVRARWASEPSPEFLASR
jgi:AAA+ superfamily predicted ATPase